MAHYWTSKHNPLRKITKPQSHRSKKTQETQKTLKYQRTLPVAKMAPQNKLILVKNQSHQQQQQQKKVIKSIAIIH